jgi:hypothetical protein
MQGIPGPQRKAGSQRIPSDHRRIHARQSPRRKHTNRSQGCQPLGGNSHVRI